MFHMVVNSLHNGYKKIKKLRKDALYILRSRLRHPLTKLIERSCSNPHCCCPELLSVNSNYN